MFEQRIREWLGLKRKLLTQDEKFVAREMRGLKIQANFIIKWKGTDEVIFEGLGVEELSSLQVLREF